MPLNFAEFSTRLSYDDIPQDVLSVLRRSFTDTMGVAAVGSTTDLSVIARKGALAMFGVGTAGASAMLMDGRLASPVGAAMAGAFLVDSVDAHDGNTWCKGHAGSAVFPSLIAMCQAEAGQGRPVDGKRFAELLAVAYEVSYRAGVAQHATCADYHTSGAWTAVGVGAAGATLLGGNAEIVRHAAGIAEYHGPRSQMMRAIDHPTMVRDGVGWGAPAGVSAAYLALDGFTGAPALTCEGEDAAMFWEDLGQGWRIPEQTHYKAYPCCRWAHPAMDAVQDLMQDYNLHHSMISHINVKTFHNATRLAGHTPLDLDEFTYSIAFPVAAIAVRGQVGVEELTPSTLQDPDILRLSQATRLIDDDHYTKISVGKRWAEVSLELKDGRTVTSEPRSPRGDSDVPLSDGEISTKFHRFADPVLGTDRANRLEQMSASFDALSSAEFADLLTLCTDAPDARDLEQVG